ncbi:diguanylate cyclase [Acinetobacter sp. MD2]|uniref:diguanylate cyclase n=1 Tax=Acinetobacter sp. MD2 TaxID=2600066 RepID=UPI002D1ECCD6|nr:diguanylate cyclase [Acinetobacter sp. MD2]MEB3767582.1 diguanylate cyclase [Acinetobacter sp. MD2]
MLQVHSLRNRLLILFAGMSLILGLCITLYIGEIASAQMKRSSGEALYETARSTSQTLANSLGEREREIILLSQSPFFAEADFNNPRVQQQLDQVKKSYQYYAWLGIADMSGHVAVAADQLLKGADVSERPWFANGLQHVYLGDVHKAVLLAKLLKSNDPNEPMRFIDFASPIYDPITHQVKGVLAAHADWRWAADVLKTVLPQDAKQQGIDVFIVNKEGDILYPFQSIDQVTPPNFKANHANYFMDAWDTDQQYLTSDVPVVAKTAMDLGWRVVIRQPVKIALADVYTLQHKIMLISAVLSLLLLWLTYQLANSFSRPIVKLAMKAYEVEQGKENIHFKTRTRIQEIQGLSNSLESMKETLLQQKNQLQEANGTLEQKVQERTSELELANQHLEKLARYDVLTGLYNRRASNDYLQYLYEEGQSYAVLLMDIDFFKRINDHYGHDVGDQVLQQVAQSLPQDLRSSDIVARFGGEEFLVLLPDSDIDGAMVLAERIRQRIAEAVILEQHPITISIGVSVFQTQDENANDAIRRADQGLYAAKAQGRNCVVSML